LIEGFAFLASRIRKRLDDDLQQVYDGLLSLLWPNYLSPIPSCCILQFKPRISDIPAGVTVPKGSEIDAVPTSKNVRCRYMTSYQTWVAPILLNDVQINPQSGACQLILKFKMAKGADLSAFAQKRLPIHIIGEPNSSYQLFDLLLGHKGGRRSLQRVALKANTPAGERTTHLAPDVLEENGFEQNQSLVPYPNYSFWGFGLLREYFTFPEKFLSFNLNVFPKLAAYESVSGFEVVLDFDSPWPSHLRISRENLQLNCVPATNVFRRDSEPIRVDHKRSEYKIVVDTQNPDHYQVFSVESVEGILVQKGTRRKYHSLYSKGWPSLAENEGEPPYYCITREKSAFGGWDAFLSPILPPSESEFPEEEVLSINLYCTNGFYGSQPLPGQINNPVSDVLRNLRPVNLTQPTQAFFPPLGQMNAWKWLGHASLNYTTLGSVEQFRSMLALYDVTDTDSNQRKIKGVKSIEVKPNREMIHGAWIVCNDINLTLDSEYYSDQGDIQLFCYCLRTVLASYASINAMVRLNVKLEPAGKQFVFEPKFGVISTL
jgi:type VI secretion system protein ImpG